MPVSQPSLFFQIAAGLIPLLLAATGLNDAFKAERKALSGRTWWLKAAVLTGVILFLGVVVVAEFFAIAEAVAAHRVVPAFRLTVVAAVIGAETAILGVALLWPWLALLPRAVALLIGYVIVLAAVIVGSTVLTQSVLDANHHLDTLTGFCLNKEFAGIDGQTLSANDRRARDILRIQALKDERAKARRSKHGGLKTIKRVELLTVQLVAVQDDLAATNAYLKDLTRLQLPFRNGSHPSVEDILATFGC